MYPVSNPFDGQALNITCTSYINTLNFGFTGCRDSLPHMQHLAIYMGDALIELEAAYGLSGDETSPAGHVRAACGVDDPWTNDESAAAREIGRASCRESVGTAL